MTPEQTTRETIRIVEDIRSLMLDYKHQIRSDCAFYIQDLLNNLFRHSYAKIDFIIRDLGVTRKTVAKYLDELAEKGFVRRKKLGKNACFVNAPLFEIFSH